MAGAALVYVMVFLGLDVGRAVAGLPIEMPRTLHRVGATLRINQYWRMFAPDPPDREAWAAIDGRLANGQRLDPLRRAAPLLDKPAAFAGEYPSFRWHLYLLTFAGDGPRHHFAGILRRSLAAYLCRDWNSRHAEDERLVSIRIWRLVEPTRLDGGAEIARDRVFEASCRELAPDPGG